MPQLDVQKVPSIEDRSLPIFAEFDRLADQIRLEAFNLFARRGGGDGHALDDWLAAERQICWPAAKLLERDSEFVLEVAIAGFEPKEITVTATPREIIVKADRERESKSDTESPGEIKWTEFRSNNVMRRVELPSAVDVSKVTASLKNGLLTITAPKAEAPQETGTRIPVSAEA
jgi:HSP20 family protein